MAGALQHAANGRLRGFATALVLAALLIASRPALAIGPDSPEVKDAIEKAIAYLEDADDARLGARCLVGLTFLKYGAEPSHPKIQRALQDVLAATKGGPEGFSADIYSTGISIMFLCALDPSKYRPEIEVIVKSLYRRQKRQGAWGYASGDHAATCDTSMTQYAVLGLWEAEDQAGVETPPAIWDKVARWLILTQAADGGWGYQGNPAAGFGQHAKQEGVKDSMTAAAMGALYITRNQLGHGELKKRADDETPAALRPYETADERAKRLKTKIDLRHFYKAIVAGNQWMDSHMPKEPKGWIYYYLYALERYQSLREADDDRQNRNPRWYQDGAAFLVKEQKDEGYWQSVNEEMKVPDTCFGTLFLLRSTRKSLEKASVYRHQASAAAVGRGFPQSGDVRLRDGSLVVQPLDAKTDEVLAIVGDPNHAQFERAREALADFVRTGPKADVEKRSSDLIRLALRGRSDVRYLAIEGLARLRNLDHVPVFIHLLNDPDVEVLRLARDALRTISRKPSGFGLGLDPGPIERQNAIEKWKEWYSTVRPDVDIDSLDLLSSS